MPQGVISVIESFATGFFAALGVTGGIALVALVLKFVGKKFVEETIKHKYESLRLTIAHKQKIIETMVVELHQFAKIYYMPMISSIGNFRCISRRGGIPSRFAV